MVFEELIYTLQATPRDADATFFFFFLFFFCSQDNFKKKCNKLVGGWVGSQVSSVRLPC